MIATNIDNEVAIVAVDANPTVWGIYCEICAHYVGEFSVSTRDQNRQRRVHLTQHKTESY